MLQVLTEQDLHRIHDASLEILESNGVTFHESPEAMEVLRAHGGRVDGFRVRFPRRLVEEALGLLPNRNQLSFDYAPLAVTEPMSLRKGESHVGLIGNAFYVYDYRRGSHRDCVEEDEDDKCLILDNLQNVEYDCCNLVFHSERVGKRIIPDFQVAEDAAAFLRRRVRDRQRALNLTGRHANTLPLRLLSRTDRERLLEGLSIVVLQGREDGERLIERCFIPFVWCNPKSPLQYSAGETGGIIAVGRSSSASRWAMISPEVMLGATGPVTVAGALAQQNAEILAGTVLAQLVQENTPVIYGCVTAPMDLRTAEISQGNFETALINAAAVQMADHYGMPSRIAPGNSSAREPGARAVTEMTLGVYMGLAAGGNLITTGLLDSTVMVSYEHLVLLDELIGQLKSATRLVDTGVSGLALDVIKEHGHPSPDFLGSDHTLEHMKRDVYYSDYTGRTTRSYQDWYQKAHDRVTRVLDRQPTDDPLDPAIEERLSAVEARLREDNQSWRSGRDDWWSFYVQDL
jgi:trimethylamine--corrinoid protein Co-methyltransferase